MTDSIPTPAPAAAAKVTAVMRFTLDRRLEHIVVLVSFTLLGLTGLIQKFSQAGVSLWLIAALGGIEMVRLIHRTNALIMVAGALYHAASVAYQIAVLRTPLSMLPWLGDLQHLVQDVLCYLGLRRRPARYGRYSYAEKAEYWAMVWGTLIMGLTGFIMWNPVLTARLLPGEFIPAAKAAHGAEAILAVLAILLWHFYHVHLKTFNTSIFLGKLSREEMEHEHAQELHEIESGQAAPPPPPAVLRRRQRVFFPAATVCLLAAGGGLFWGITFSQPSLITVPAGETVAVYVPFTPTPSPVPTATATPLPPGAVITWQSGMGQLFANRCGTCHGATKAGGLSILTYVEAVHGGQRGPGIVLGRPEDSAIVQVQSAGGHPGQFTAQELAQVVEWIKLGAPEK
jgi:cytochrome b subunit of formate dehydrogenase